MKIILIYDIHIEDEEDRDGPRRLRNTFKICKKYLNPVQKSVFEGEITEGSYRMLLSALLRVIDKDVDNVVIYKLFSENAYKREIITNTEDPTSNFI